MHLVGVLFPHIKYDMFDVRCFIILISNGEDLTLSSLAIQMYETNQVDVIDEGIYHMTNHYNPSVRFLLEISKYSLNLKGTAVCL